MLKIDERPCIIEKMIRCSTDGLAVQAISCRCTNIVYIWAGGYFISI